MEDIKIATASNLKIWRAISLLIILELFCSFSYEDATCVDDDTSGANDINGHNLKFGKCPFPSEALQNEILCYYKGCSE